jgi:hypothetical protein
MPVYILANGIIPDLQPIMSHHPPPLPPVSPKVNYAAFIPFLAVVAEVPWLAVIVIGTLIHTGKFDPDPAQTHLLDLIAMIPVAFGLAAGIFVALRGRSHRWIERVFLIVGSIICLSFLCGFGWELFH